jgi:hypothetical protein
MFIHNSRFDTIFSPAERFISNIDPTMAGMVLIRGKRDAWI